MHGDNMSPDYRAVSWICNTSVDDARSAIKEEDDIGILRLALQYEKFNRNRAVMIRNIGARIRQIEAAS